MLLFSVKTNVLTEGKLTYDPSSIWFKSSSLNKLQEAMVNANVWDIPLYRWIIDDMDCTNSVAMKLRLIILELLK